MKHCKKIICTLLAVVLMLTTVSLPGFAGMVLPEVDFALKAKAATAVDSGSCGDNLTWTLDDEGILYISGSGDMEEFYYYGAAPWYDYTGQIRAVIIEEDVTGISSYAFADCTALISVVIPETVVNLGSWIFDACGNLAYIYYTGTQDEWNALTFYESDGSFYYIVKVIYNYDYSDCAHAWMESRRITQPTETQEGSAVFDCLLCGTQETMALDPVTILVTEACGTNVTWSFDNYYTLTISGTGDMYDNIVYGKSSAEYEFPASAKKIVIEEGVTGIGDCAFWYNPVVTEIIIADSVISIGRDAFINTAYFNDEANWEDGALYIGDCLIAVDDSHSGTYAIKDGTTRIGGEAFAYNENLTGIIVPDSVISIGDYAFYDCPALSDIRIPDSVKMMGSYIIANNEYAADENNWTDGVLYIDNHLIVANPEVVTGDYTVKNGTKTIAGSAFYGCEGLTGLTMPDSVVSVGEWAFSYCDALSDVVLSANIQFIGESAFSECYALTDIRYAGTQADWNAVVVGEDNAYLIEATMHFGSVGSDDFTESEDAVLTEDGGICAMAGKTAEELLAQAGAAATLVDDKGNALAADAKVGTGAVLTLADGTQYEIVVQGDTDGDGVIVASDARFALRYSVGLENAAASAFVKAAAVDELTGVSSSDARTILRASVGLDNPADWFADVRG